MCWWAVSVQTCTANNGNLYRRAGPRGRLLLQGRPDDKTPADLLEPLTQHHEPIGTLDNAAKIFVRG